jgi:ubiquitin carboxyl-terminal hydrolase 34
MALWPLLNTLIAQAVMQPEKCEETLSVALLVFRKLADTSIESVDVENCLLSWGSLLVQHKSQEVYGLTKCFFEQI